MESSLEKCLVLGEPKDSSGSAFCSSMDVLASAADYLPFTPRQLNLHLEAPKKLPDSVLRALRDTHTLGLVLFPFVTARCHTLLGFQDLPGLPGWKQKPAFIPVPGLINVN